jgi:hypothetical protein
MAPETKIESSRHLWTHRAIFFTRAPDKSALNLSLYRPIGFLGNAATVRTKRVRRLPCSWPATLRRSQVAAGLAGLTGFFDLAGLPLADFFAVAGLILSGLPAAAGAAMRSGSGALKNTRQPGLSWDLFLIMQTVTRSTSGMSLLHRRNASPLHACCCSGV